ncbi:MAG: GNAT family N-acetyltransferase [Lactobacillus sp.]|jgi:GNAT superfamily N-acetyltransferase|nr:GNAT family N-acetyltransferase [Lactobacillus sp.]
MITHTDHITGSNLDTIAQIWLTSNLEAHSFIDPNYWQQNFAAVKQQLATAELFIFNDTNDQITGFLGLSGDYIAGLFVAAKFRGEGIGHQLLTAAKTSQAKLTLSVYAKNKKAVNFYSREGFCLTNQEIDEPTGELALQMTWTKYQAN